MTEQRDLSAWLSELDQAAEQVAETVATMWWAIFRRLVEKGFSEEQAVEIVKAMVHGRGYLP